MEHLYQNQQTFESQAIPDGFRLARLEVYNWGTFNQHVWVMAPCNGTALLTGANASGKSTLVDALLTLLVPYHRRTYNQASGTEKRRERDERTYILGAWSKQKDSASSQARPEYLRDKTSYSVLLAVFQNIKTKRDITLAQVLRVADDGVDKFFVVAPFQLTIVEHFGLTGTLTELRKKLKTLGVEGFTDFAAYNRRFRQLVNVRSEKAFDLFNQIVSLKEIGGLNAFVREHMLEKTNPQARITQLRANFENLTRAHDAIVLAQKQLDILEPLIKDANKYVEQQAKISEAQSCGELVPIYVAGRKYTLLETALATAQQELATQKNLMESITSERKRLQQQHTQLSVTLGNNQIGQQIAQLKQEIRFRSSAQDTKQTQANGYNSLAKQLGLPEYQNEGTFYTTLRRAKDILAETSKHLESLRDERDKHVPRLAGVQETCCTLQAEITSLQQRKSQIPTQDITIRQLLLDELRVAEDEIPFIGELIRIRDTEKQWEAAIERLLHGFAVQLLVPERYYHQASHFVEKTHLGRRLVYHRIGTTPHSPRNTIFPDSNMLYNKLEIKAGTSFSDWLSTEVIDRYDYLCCDTLEAFQQARRALTVNGQIKHTPVHHEKDDRKSLGDRTSYVLGWNNVEKLHALKTELSEQKRIHSELETAIQRVEQAQEREQARKLQLQQILAFESFTVLDWKTDERLVLELKAQVRDLEKDSSLAALHALLADVEKQLDVVEDTYNTLNGKITTLDNTVKQYITQLAGCDKKRQSKPEYTLLLASIEKEHDGKELTLETVDSEENVLLNFYNRRVHSLQGILNPLGVQIVLRMQDLRQMSAVIAQEVDASLEAVEQYRRYYEQIKREDLPRHSKRFKDLLNDKVIIDINSFKAGLEQQEKEIEASIEKLNTSLHKIDYTLLTYIELCSERTHDQEVREFKNELRACLPDVSQQRTGEANEASFQRIHTLLQRFEQDDRWTTKVTDVRNWLDFSAQELYREDGKRKNYYSDSSGKSGGQKAKLAYTILASAIAYQYGLDQEEGHERTFRFVVVDEAFSKSDEMNARYAMELFQQLNLQLLVVTPLDKIHVIEPYISACHYVVNNEEENDSKVYNLSIEQYHQQKQAIQAGAMVHDYAD